MVDEVNLSLYLICHHGHLEDILKDARLVQRVAFEKRMPLTLFFSGDQLDQMAKHRGAIHNELWFDLVSAIQGDHFIDPRRGKNSPYHPELGIMTFNHVPLVQPWFSDQKEYTDGILPDQIGFESVSCLS